MFRRQSACCCRNNQCCSPAVQPIAESRGVGLIGGLIRIALLYALAVFTSGTLIQTGNPNLVAVGEVIQTITFVEPLTLLAISANLDPVAGALDWLAGGLDPSPVIVAVRDLLM